MDTAALCSLLLLTVGVTVLRAAPIKYVEFSKPSGALPFLKTVHKSAVAAQA